MGTEVECKNSSPGYHSMRNVNEDLNSRSWHIFYGDSALINSHYYGDFTPRTVTDEYQDHEKYELKEKMLQHEAIFKNQVYELHRLYKRQRDIMEEVKRKELQKYRFSIDTSSSLSLMPSQKPYKDAQKWQNPSLPYGNCTFARLSIFGAEISNSPSSCSKDCEIVECKPSKVRKRLFDLELPAHQYIEPKEEQVIDNQGSEISSHALKETCFLPKNGEKTFLDDGLKKDGYKDTASSQRFMGYNGLTDLNKPAFQTPSMQQMNGKEVQNRGSFLEISRKYPFVYTSNMGNSWYPSGSSWGKPIDSLTYYGKNMGSGGNVSVYNGFYHGSSSGSKDSPARLPSVGFDYQNCTKIDDGTQKIVKGSNFVDLTGSSKGMDLNTVQTLSDEEDDSRKCDQKVLPWLRAKPAMCKNESSSGNNRKLLGVSICENVSMEHRGIDINVALDDVSDSEHNEKQIDDERREETDGEIKNFKNHFDLNSCLTEDDDLLDSESDKSLKKKKTFEIDLEAPAISETEEESEELQNIAAEAIVSISGQQDQEGSNSHSAIDDDNKHDPLLWFVNVIDSFKKNVLSPTHEIDEYEMLTLRLEETKEEDYIPTPLAPEIQEPDEVGPTLTTRPRRGQARRGRPHRDFQRDILPGLTSLSRLEITEDLQIFGGLMKATGHPWSLGSMRKNGKKVRAQGRRKVKAMETTFPAPPPPPPLPPLLSKSVEVLGLEERRLTGWGKTTRRPRRQRCASGNSIAVHIT